MRNYYDGIVSAKCEVTHQFGRPAPCPLSFSKRSKKASVVCPMLTRGSSRELLPAARTRRSCSQTSTRTSALYNAAKALDRVHKGTQGTGGTPVLAPCEGRREFGDLTAPAYFGRRSGEIGHPGESDQAYILEHLGQRPSAPVTVPEYQ